MKAQAGSAGSSTHPGGVRGDVLEAERIIELAADIGDFFAPYPPDRAVEGVRNHLRSYWDPRMRDALRRILASESHELPPHVVAGARALDAGSGLLPKSYYGPPKA